MIELRTAKSYDWPDIVDLLSESGIAGALEIGSVKNTTVAEDGGTFVGAAIVEPLGEWGIVHAVGVLLGWQRRGVGTALLARAMADAGHRGARWVFGASSQVRFLSAAGFEIERRELIPAEAIALLKPNGGDFWSMHVQAPG